MNDFKQRFLIFEEEKKKNSSSPKEICYNLSWLPKEKKKLKKKRFFKKL